MLLSHVRHSFVHGVLHRIQETVVPTMKPEEDCVLLSPSIVTIHIDLAPSTPTVAAKL